MQRFFIRFGLFALFAVTAWLGMFWVISHSYTLEYRLIGQETNWGYVNQRTSEWAAKAEHTEDVLFFGSSTCYSGIDPHALEAFGMNGFNFCSSSQAVGNSALLLDAALQDHRPNVVALDVYPWIWGATGPAIESTKDWIVNSNLRGSHWSRAYRWLALESADLFTIFTSAYYDLVRPSKPAGANPHLPDDPKGDYRGLGFVARSFAPLDSIECEDLYREMSEFECEAISDMRAQCEAAGAQLVVINPPQLCEETFEKPACFEGLTYIDGNRWPGAKTPQHYYDDHHLVEAGALSYSAWLAAEIAKLPRD